ncbi:uncharacterized protein LOC113662366 isoform X4 [Tachysurus fulvidraco]|uniref:uncharacterized protein LOC113662366 isoform X4 n=1 Tax=Tachysurus fulvidraco TaxID=1234273 RepID=UPI001FEE6A00|nr:uncharacterized protein LOC113662366 isoform X4 [Tachysurus fulvidraco]
MMKCLYLLYVVFHVTAGCDLSGDETVEIIQHQGGSVLLPCSCSDLHTKPHTFTWMSYRTGHVNDMLNDEHYRDRLQLFNKSSPGNLSLLISDLREEDQGDYRCSTEKGHRDIRIYVKGCDLSAETKYDYIGHPGGSVLLLCSCSDLHTKPHTFTWMSYIRREDAVDYRCSIEKGHRGMRIYVKGCDLSDNETVKIIQHQGGSVLLPCSCSDLNIKPHTFTWMSYRTGRLNDMLNDEHYRDRLQLFNHSSPGNLSLLISDLREEDQGDYRCRTEKGHRDIRIYVKGCELVKETDVESITVFTGESVVLPCVCTDLQDKPKSLKWDFSIPTETGRNRYQEIYPEQTGHHRNRVKLISKSSPGNLSLLVSDLTEQDQGLYTCSVQAERKDFRLYVKGTCGENGITEGRPDCKGKPTDQAVISLLKLNMNTMDILVVQFCYSAPALTCTPNLTHSPGWPTEQDV